MNYIETIILTGYEKRLIEAGGTVLKTLSISSNEILTIQVSKNQLQIERRVY